MSDLISRRELLEEIKSLSIVLNGKQIFSDDAKDTVLRIINEQPTAYSVDKIVEELEELKVIKDGSIPIIHGKAELELHDKAIRNKAIDDLSNILKENYDYLPQIFSKEAFVRYIDEYAEQLKAGVEE